MKTIKTIKLLAVLFISAFTFSACSSDDHDDDHSHEEELITTVTYTLTDVNDNVVTMTFTDLDGEGGNAAIYDISGPLTANTDYVGVVKLENATESPAEDITEEVKTEGDEHEFFYISNVGIITKTDQDVNNNLLGIETTLTTGTTGTAITIILKHEPKKPNTGVTDAGGSTDLEVTFNVTID